MLKLGQLVHVYSEATKGLSEGFNIFSVGMLELVLVSGSSVTKV